MGTDCVTDFLKLSVYTAFFCVLLVFYGLPIHIMRDLFMTTRSFVKRLTALLKYKQALRDMNRYPDATSEELGREDTCIICREEMRPWDPNAGQLERHRPKKLPCGHILHFGCLKSWLERQQVCPTCRSSVVADQHPRNGAYRRRMAFHIAPNLANGQNQAGAANGQAPGVQDAQLNGQPGQPGQQPAAPRAAMRYINLGPIRLGFAQGGQEVAELANRMGVDLNGANAPIAPQANAPVTTPADLSTMEAVRNRLLEVDQRIQQEVRDIQTGIQSVQTAQQELQLINVMLAELARIRQTQNQQHTAPQPGQPTVTPLAANTPAAGVHPSPMPPPMMFPQLPHPPAGQIPLPAFPPAPHHFIPRMNSPTITRHGTTANATAIPSGSSELPEGVTIPPGWSLLPLQRLDPAAPAPGGPTPGALGVQVNNLDPLHQNGTAPTQPSSSADAAASGNESATTSEAPNVDSSQPAHISTAAPPVEVAAPTPVTPHWGGSAQLFGGGSSSSSLPFGLQPADSSRSASETRDADSNNSDHTEARDGTGASDSSTPAATTVAGEGNGAPSSPHSNGKGKARVSTVEDVEEE